MKELAVHHTDWLLGLLFAAMALVLGLRLYDRKRLFDFAILPFHARRRELEESFSPIPGKGFVDLSISLLSTVVLAVSCFLLLHPWQGALPLFSDWVLFLRLIFVLLVFFLFKNFMGLLVGWVFNQSEEIAQAQNINLAYRSWLGIVLLPVCIIAVFVPQLYPYVYYLLLVVMAAGYYFALQFSAIRIWRIPVVPYYKIFYLCALEIMPLIFLIGWLASLVG